MEIDAKTIEELRALLAKATPGPWEVDYLDKNGQRVIRQEHIEIATFWHHSVGSIEKEMEANAALVVAAINALPALLNRLEKAEGELAEAREDVRSLCRFILNEWGPDGALKATTLICRPRYAAGFADRRSVRRG